MGYIGAGISRFNTADELTVTGDAEFNGNANFGDSDKVSFSSGKLEMYHDGTNAYIDETYANGTFLIRGNNISLQKYTGETMIQCVSDGKVELNFNNVPKLETTSSGVDVTGTAVVDALTCSGSATIEGTSTFGTSSADTRFNFDGPNQYRAVFKHSGNIAGQIGGGGADELRFSNAAGAIVASITGGGITFNGDTAAANALDDYEEGTYTPAFTSTGATFSYSVQLGSYVKIGQLVCCWFNITLNASPSGTTNQQVTFNVPFATNNVDNSLYSGGHIGHYFNINLGSGTSIAYQLPSASSTQIELKEIGDNIGENGIVASELNSSAVIRGSVMYRAAS